MGANSSKSLTKDQVDELARKTGFTRQEVEQIHKSFLIDYPDGKIPKDKFLNKNEKELYQAMYNMWQPQPDLTFPHYLLGMSMVTSDTYYGEKYDMLYKLFECPNKKGFVDTQSMQQFFLTLLASLTPEERETLPQELQTVDSLMKKFQSDFRIDKKEIAKDDFITTIKIYKH